MHANARKTFIFSAKKAELKPNLRQMATIYFHVNIGGPGREQTKHPIRSDINLIRRYLRPIEGMTRFAPAAQNEYYFFSSLPGWAKSDRLSRNGLTSPKRRPFQQCIQSRAQRLSPLRWRIQLRARKGSGRGQSTILDR